MYKRVWIYAAMLSVGFFNAAWADDTTGQRSKRAQRVLATLKMFGIADTRLSKLVEDTSSHIEKDGYFYVTDHKMEDGRLALRFECRGAPKLRQMQLAYVPKDSHYTVTATTRAVMFNYRYAFK